MAPRPIDVSDDLEGGADESMAHSEEQVNLSNETGHIFETFSQGSSAWRLWLVAEVQGMARSWQVGVRQLLSEGDGNTRLKT